MNQIWFKDQSLLTSALELNLKQSLVCGWWICNENNPKENSPKGN